MRTIIDLPEEQLEALDALCHRERISRAEAIRRAVTGHLAAQRAPAVARAFGLWRNRRVNAVSEQRRLRREWER